MKSEYKILTDITCDLSQKNLDKIGVTAMPLHVIIDNKDYLHYADYRNISLADFLSKLRSCKEIKTSQLDIEIAENTMRSILEEGKDILYITFSSSLSGTFSTAVSIASELAEEFPERKIRVVDSLSASGGLGMLVFHAVKQQKSGMELDALCDWILEKRNHIGHWFTVDDLEHLRRGGRISGATSLVGSLLKIKPILHMDGEGKLVPHSKVNGRKKSVNALIDKMRRYGVSESFDMVFICHSGLDEDAFRFKESILENFEVNEIISEHIDPVIAAHTGYGGLAVFFECKER